MKKLLLGLLLALTWAAPTFGAAPDFALSDQNGATVKLADYKGKIVVLEWTNPDCPFVKRHYRAGTMKSLAQQYGAKGVVWLAINSSHFWTATKAQTWSKEVALPYPLLDDSSGTVGKSYGAKTTPHMFIVGKDGAIAYRGAIDDDADGESESPHNYIKTALDELLSGGVVSTPETKPYGCSVKYG